jgi:excisionase family DNA binding protein
MDDLISAKEAAKILGVSYRTVIRLAEDGKIVGRLLSKQWVISRVSVEEYKQGLTPEQATGLK